MYLPPMGLYEPFLSTTSRKSLHVFKKQPALIYVLLLADNALIGSRIFAIVENVYDRL